MNKYSIVTVTRNSYCIFNQILSFDNQDQGLTKYIIIDNASSQEFVSELELVCEASEIRDKIEILKQKNNLLFSKANNIGILNAIVSEIDHVVLLNPDVTFIERNPIQKIIEEMKLHNASIGSPRLLFSDKSTIEFCGAKDNSHLMYGAKDDPSDCSIITYPDIEWLTGAFMAIKADLFGSIGYLDHLTYTHWCSDQEFCRRAVLTGCNILLSSVRAIHDQGKSVTFNPHEEVKKDLEEGVVPNIIPFSLEHIKMSALRNTARKNREIIDRDLLNEK